MDNKIVEELVGIEQMADAVLKKLSNDRGKLSQRINEEIARKTAEIDGHAEQTIKSLYKAASGETEAKVKKVTEDARRRAGEVKSAFGKHRESWRADLVKRVLEY